MRKRDELKGRGQLKSKEEAHLLALVPLVRAAVVVVALQVEGVEVVLQGVASVLLVMTMITPAAQGRAL